MQVQSCFLFVELLLLRRPRKRLGWQCAVRVLRCWTVGRLASVCRKVRQLGEPKNLSIWRSMRRGLWFLPQVAITTQSLQVKLQLLCVRCVVFLTSVCLVLVFTVRCRLVWIVCGFLVLCMVSDYGILLIR